MKILNCLILFICLPQFVFAQKVNWSIVGLDGKKFLDVKAKDILISGNDIWFMKSGLYGLMDNAGNVILEPRYKEIEVRKMGFTEVYKDGCWGMVKNGKEIIPLVNSRFSIEYDKDTIIAHEGCSPDPDSYIITEPIFYDLNGTRLTPELRCSRVRTEFTYCRENKAETRKKTPLEIIEYCNFPGKEVDFYYVDKEIKNGFKIFRIHEGSPSYFLKRGSMGILNSHDSIIFESQESYDISDMHEGFIRIESGGWCAGGYKKKYSLIDTTGVTIGTDFDFLRFNQYTNSIIFGKDSAWGWITSEKKFHNLLKDNKCDGITPVNENYFLVSYKNSGTSLLNASGKVIIAADSGNYISAINQNCLLARSSKNHTFICPEVKEIQYGNSFVVSSFDYSKLIEKSGRRFFGCGLSMMDGMEDIGKPWDYPVIYPTSIFVVEKDSLKGIFDAELYKEIIRPEYDDIYKISDSHFAVRKNSKWGIVDNNGKIIVPVECARIRNFDKYYAISKEPFNAD